MNKKRKEMILAILAVISIVIITTGVTYAFFNYVKEGSTENSMTTGSITFLYTEVSGVGRGISVSNAFPVSDEVGKAQVGEGNVFDFKVTSTTPRNANIPYEVTARMKSDSTLDPSAVKVYLTEAKGDMETEILLDQYSNLAQTNISVPENIIEKTIYTDTVPANSADYEKDFRLRMWISEDTDFSDGSMNGKTFTLTVNVYANAEIVSSPAANTLSQTILANNRLITAEPTLTTSSNNSDDASGLYRSTATNTGEPTYYFRGEVENNYVSFAGFTWRIIRINEDGTVRLIMDEGVNQNKSYSFNSNKNNYSYMYYSNSDAKSVLESWYQTNLLNYTDKIATGNYFCEEARVKYDSNHISNQAQMSIYKDYIPNFKCQTDGNGYGMINSNIGLISYEEAVFAGGYPGVNNDRYYLNRNSSFWLISPAGFYIPSSSSAVWKLFPTGYLNSADILIAVSPLYPVINLNSDVKVIGSGIGSDPYIVQ